MPTDIKLPEVGDNITQGTVVSVLVKVGDTIEVGQAVVEIETDKAVVEVPAEAGGTVQEVKVNVGDSVPIGGVLLTVDSDGPATTAPTASSTGGTAGGGDEQNLVDSAPVVASEPRAADVAQQQQAAQEVQASGTDQTPSSQAPAQHSGTSTEVNVTLPDVGDNIAQGTVVSVLVAVGDSVTEGQPVLELETDKAVVEVPSSAAGTVQSLAVTVGQSVPIGATLLTLSSGSSASSQPSQPQPQSQSPVPPSVPQQASSQPAPATSAPASSASAQSAATPTAPLKSTDGRVLVHAAPSVRRQARELGLDLTQLQGSGIAGRISAEDLKAAVSQLQHQNQPQDQAQQAAPAPLATAPLPNFEKWGSVRREDMSGIRKATVRSMGASTAIPMVTHFDKADVTHMEEARKKFGPRVEQAGGKLTMTHIIMKVVAGALRKFPKFGASLDLAKQQVVYKEYVNLGVAVDTPQGLLVPVLKDADRLSITEMVLELNELAQKARDRKLKPDEMQGATFTISNLGGIGGYAFTPIVNAPEVAILGVSRGGIEPVWNKEKGEFEPRNMLPLTLSYDHRLIDGADAARFMRYICEALEDPFLISL